MTDEALEACRAWTASSRSTGRVEGTERPTACAFSRGLPRLRHLDLGGTAVTDRGLAVLRELPALESISLAGTRVTDAGLGHLAGCHALRSVDLSWTRTGDGALAALAGKAALSRLSTGEQVTDAGIRSCTSPPGVQAVARRRTRRWRC